MVCEQPHWFGRSAGRAAEGEKESGLALPGYICWINFSFTGQTQEEALLIT